MIDLGGSSILDCTCWSRVCLAFENCWYSWLVHFAQRWKCCQIDNYCSHPPSI